MTVDPPDPKFSNALAAYRSAGNLRQPQPTAQVVRLIAETSAPTPSVPAPSAPVPPEQSVPPGSPAPAASPSTGVSLMITNAQKDSLRRLGLSEHEIRDMSPTEAHRRLGLSAGR